jgi:hypothetical protein
MNEDQLDRLIGRTLGGHPADIEEVPRWPSWSGGNGVFRLTEGDLK